MKYTCSILNCGATLVATAEPHKISEAIPSMLPFIIYSILRHYLKHNRKLQQVKAFSSHETANSFH